MNVWLAWDGYSDAAWYEYWNMQEWYTWEPIAEFNEENDEC